MRQPYISLATIFDSSITSTINNSEFVRKMMLQDGELNAATYSSILCDSEMIDEKPSLAFDPTESTIVRIVHIEICEYAILHTNRDQMGKSLLEKLKIVTNFYVNDKYISIEPFPFYPSSITV